MERDMDMIRDLLLTIEGDPLLGGVREKSRDPSGLGITTGYHAKVAHHLTLRIKYACSKRLLPL